MLIVFLSFPIGYRILRFSLRKSLSFVTKNRADPRRESGSLERRGGERWKCLRKMFPYVSSASRIGEFESNQVT